MSYKKNVSSKQPGEVKDYVLKLKGKVSALQPLELGNNYKVVIQGSITSVTEHDEQDGSFTYEYVLKPVNVEVIDKLGVTIKTKDPRSFSQKFRAMMYRLWEQAPDNYSSEEHYEAVMKWVLHNADYIDTMSRKV